MAVRVIQVRMDVLDHPDHLAAVVAHLAHLANLDHPEETVDPQDHPEKMFVFCCTVTGAQSLAPLL